MRTEQEITDKIKELQANLRYWKKLPHDTKNKTAIINGIEAQIGLLQWVLKDELPF